MEAGGREESVNFNTVPRWKGLLKIHARYSHDSVVHLADTDLFLVGRFLGG